MCAVFCPMAAVNMPINWTDKTYLDDGGENVVGTSCVGSRVPVDDSLTSLNWLHNLNIMGEIHTTTPPTPPASPGPLGAASDSYGTINNGGGYGGLCNGGGASDLRRFGKSTTDSKNSATMGPPLCSSMAPGTICQTSGGSSGCRKNGRAALSCQFVVDDVDYKSNGDVKPPYSYATLICMAMKANKNKMSLSAIYKWIRDNFMYYRREDTGWQNSIRHNLSLNKCFIKVPRNKDEPGKGGFWRLDPTYAEEMADGTFKKRRMSNRPAVSKVSKVERSMMMTMTATTMTMTTTKKDIAGSAVDPNAHTYYLPPPPPPMQPTSGPTSMSELEASLLPLTPLAPHLVPSSSRSPLHLVLDDEAETEAATSSLKGDFCWNSVLNEDIELDGLRYKTLDIVDMDVVTNDIAAYHRTPLSSGQQLQSDGIGCLDSPALSLDADDLLVNSDASNDLTSADNLDLAVHVGSSHIVSTQDWWRLTMAAVEGSLTGGVGVGSCVSMANVTNSNSHTNGSVILNHLGHPDYDLAEVAAANFLGHVWDDATRPVLTGTFDLDGLVDLDGY